jgi:dihydropyrimidinase
VVDAPGCYLVPGGVDPHTHFDMPFMVRSHACSMVPAFGHFEISSVIWCVLQGTVTSDNFYTGSRAALAGGTTMFIDFCIPGRDQSLMEALKQWSEYTHFSSCITHKSMRDNPIISACARVQGGQGR